MLFYNKSYDSLSLSKNSHLASLWCHCILLTSFSLRMKIGILTVLSSLFEHGALGAGPS